jgi:nicotinamidase-related amidase
MADHKENSCKTALLIVDMISDFEFEDGEKLCPHALVAAEKIHDLKGRAKDHGAAVIYVNDNYGRWNEDFRAFAARIGSSSAKGGEITKLLAPDKNDLYVLKPQRSGFYETPLSVLLQSLKVVNLIIAGVTTDICVLFTAHDAYMRGFQVYVPADCSAAVEVKHHTSALELLERVADARIDASENIDFVKLENFNGSHDIARNVPDLETPLGTSGAS